MSPGHRQLLGGQETPRREVRAGRVEAEDGRLGVDRRGARGSGPAGRTTPNHSSNCRYRTEPVVYGRGCPGSPSPGSGRRGDRPGRLWAVAELVGQGRRRQVAGDQDVVRLQRRDPRDDLVQPLQPELVAPDPRSSSAIPTARLFNSRSGLKA